MNGFFTILQRLWRARVRAASVGGVAAAFLVATTATPAFANNASTCSNYTAGGVSFQLCLRTYQNDIHEWIYVSSGTYASGYLSFNESGTAYYGENTNYNSGLQTGCSYGYPNVTVTPGQQYDCYIDATSAKYNGLIPNNSYMWATWNSAGGTKYTTSSLLINW